MASAGVVVERLVNLVVPRILEILLRFHCLQPRADRRHRLLSLYFLGDRVVGCACTISVDSVLPAHILVRANTAFVTWTLIRAVIILHLDRLARVCLCAICAITERSIILIVIILLHYSTFEKRTRKPSLEPSSVPRNLPFRGDCPENCED